MEKMLEKAKEVVAPYATSKRVGLGAALITLLGVAQQFGLVVHPLVAVGVYLAGNIATKYLDERKKAEK